MTSMNDPAANRPASWKRQAATLLRDIFGLERLRHGQADVIGNVMAGKDTLAIMPTGAGKSLCYQLPALMLTGRTLVVSPLIALMKDQCDKLREAGIDAVQLNSSLATADIDEAEEAVRSGRARIVFTTPERLADASFRALVVQSPTSLLVIDEAHCISQWGHDFRPSFLEVGAALSALGRPTLLALTATASEDVADDIVAQLDVPLERVSTGVYRPNLNFSVLNVSNEREKLAQLSSLIAAESGPTIVYASTIKAVESVHDALTAAGHVVARYHGRLSPKERREQQDAFMHGTVRIIVATNAFGLGIDRADVRNVIHYQMPGGLDAYYQEAGRAGRDGEAARSVLLYLAGDKAVQRFFLAGRYPAFEDVEAVYMKLLERPAEGDGWTIEALHQALERPRSKVQVALVLLRRQRAVVVDRQGLLSIREGGLDTAAVVRLVDGYRRKREHDAALLEQMVFYGQTGYCRWQVLLNHFGAEVDVEHCGHCDNCARQVAANAAAVRRADQLAAAAAEPQPVALRVPNSPPATATPAAFHVGDRVRVPRYGKGVVVDADSLHVTVGFPTGERRSFLPSFVSREGGGRQRASETRRAAKSGQPAAAVAA